MYSLQIFYSNQLIFFKQLIFKYIELGINIY